MKKGSFQQVICQRGVIASCILVLCLTQVMNVSGEVGSTAPQFSLDAGGLSDGNIVTPFSNTGAAGGYWTPEGGNPTVATVDGLKAVTFTSAPRLLLTSDSGGSTTQMCPMSLIKLTPGPVNYTVYAWLYRQASGGGEAFLSWAPYQHGTCFQYIGGNGTAVDNWTAGGYVGYNPTPARGEWHFVAVTYDGTDTKLYVDGALQGSANNAFAADNVAANYPVRIGCGEQATDEATYTTVNPIRNFGGSITKLDVYDVSATAAEIASVWSNNSQTITASPSVGGSISPGTVNVPTGTSKTFTITKNPGYQVDVVVDGVNQGDIASYTFTGVITNHTIAANFTVLPNCTISGTVSAAVGGGATVSAKLTATALPVYQTTTAVDGTYSMTIPQGTWYVCASQTGYVISSDTTVNLTENRSGINFTLTAGRNVPKMENLLFEAITESLPITQGADTGNWPLIYPLGSVSAAKMGSPTVDHPDIDGPVWVMNHNGSTSDGFKVSNLPQPTVLPLNGASIVAVIKPKRVTTGEYQPVVSVLLGQLELCVKNTDGLIQVGRKGIDRPNYTSTVAIPDGQKTIISLVVQTNGTYKVFTRKFGDSVSAQVIDQTGTADMTSITAQTWYATDISIGKGWNGDGWSSFSGNIGDVFVYKTALSDLDRQTLESDLYTKFFTVPTYDITATTGANGSVTPAGVTAVSRLSSQAYFISPNFGYDVADVLVDGTSVGAVTNYTFTDVQAQHTISASFTPALPYAVSGRVTDGANGIAATIYVSLTANASISPVYVVPTAPNGDFSVNLISGTWYLCASAAGYTPCSDQTVTVAGSPIAGSNLSLSANGRNIPLQDKLIFSVLTESLPDTAPSAPWPIFMPKGAPALTVRGGTPRAVMFDHDLWETNTYAAADGYVFGGSYWDASGQHPIACNGASIVAIVAPYRSAAGGFSSIVDIFYSTLGLCVKNDTGEIQVRRNPAGSMWGTGCFIPDGQKTIVSLVVQSNGPFNVYTNGTLVYANASTTDVTSLIPGTTQYGGGNGQGAFGTYITVGRNWPDTWTVYNGLIGDVFVYKTALGDSDRIQLESDLRTKFMPPRGTMIRLL